LHLFQADLTPSVILLPTAFNFYFATAIPCLALSTTLVACFFTCCTVLLTAALP